MTPAGAAIALGLVVAACQAAPSPAARAVETFSGPGWSLALPADLGLRPRGPGPDELGGTWVSSVDGRDTRQLSLILLRDADVPLDEYVRQLQLRDGSRILRQDPVALPAGRAVYVELSNDLVPASQLVMVEPRPGLIASVSARGLTGEDLVEIARSLRIEEA